MIGVSFDHVDLGRQMNQLVAMGGISAGAAVTRVSRQIVTDCHIQTPPGAKGSRSNSAAKKRGEKTIDYDVRHTFISVDDINFTDMKVEKGIKRLVDGMGGNGRVDFKTGKEVFKNAGFNWVRDIIRDPRFVNYKQARQAGHKYVIPTATEYHRDAIIALIQKRSGYARSGWKHAMKRLHVPVPPWVRRHDGPGFFHGIKDKLKPVIELGNLVPYVQNYRNQEGYGIMQSAVLRREKMFQNELNTYFKIIARGGGAKLAAKLQRDSFWEATE